MWQSQYNNPARRDGNTHFPLSSIVALSGHNTTIPLVGMEIVGLPAHAGKVNTQVTIQQSRSSGWKSTTERRKTVFSDISESQYNNPARRDGNDAYDSNYTDARPSHNTTIPLVGMEILLKPQ